jgi:bleomycin hydrolase
MKKTILFGALVLSTQLAFGQTVTNAADSKYQFTKVVQLDANPVESQGMTGTCWSFSSLSFFESELIRLGHKNPAELAFLRSATGRLR